MSLKVKTISVRRKVNVLKKPTPTFVSLVDHAATQTPFAVVKHAQNPSGEEDMKRSQKTRGTRETRAPKPVVKTKKSGAEEIQATAQVYKLTFDQTKFTDEKSVKAWMKKYQWADGYVISKEDGDFVVKSANSKAEDTLELHEVPLDADGTVSAMIAKAGENLAGSRLKAQKAGAKAPGAGDTNAIVNGDEADGDDDGTKAAGTKDDNGGAEDDDDDNADADGDGEDDDEGDDDDTLTGAKGDTDDDGEDDDDENIEGTSQKNPNDPEFGDELMGDNNSDNEPEDDDVEDHEEVAGVDDPEGYGDREGADGSASIREKEKNEPAPKDLPGQRVTPTGAGKPGHEPGNPGKYRITRRQKAGRNPLRSVDQYIRKFDSYGVYLSGGASLKDVLSDGMTDGVPPGVSEVFQSLYKAIGNTLKAGDTNVKQDVTAIGGEFVEAVVALHDVWKGLLQKGTKSQKAAARKYFAELGEDLQTIATKSVSTEDAVEAAVKKAIAPVTEELAKTKAELAKFAKGTNFRKSFGNDDLERTPSAEVLRKREEDEDEDFISNLNRKSMLGQRRR